jgi:tetratricopeptide (TPR) repeat protein
VGTDHLDTAASLHALADLYQQQGKYAEAEPLYRRALSIYEQQVGNDHPNLATSLNNLALFYSSQGKYTQAEPLLRRALAISEQQFEAQHPTTPSARDTDKTPCFTQVITRAKQGAKNVFRRFSRRSLTGPSQTSHAIPTVTSIPTPPVARKPAAITYNGYLAATASRITMHWGYNNWNSITDTGMTKQRNGTWQASIIVPPGATALNMAFHNQSHTWDNNNTSNYHLNVRNVSKR